MYLIRSQIATFPRKNAFDQIASFSRREICELSEKFQELKGRIEEVTMEIGFVDYVEHTPDLPGQ